MNKEQIQELAMGAALVALAYALWKQFKPGTAQAAKLPAQFVTQKDGIPYDTANPGAFMTVANLLRGTVHDIMGGDTAGESIPTTNEIFRSVTQDVYASGDSQTYSEWRGDTGADSVVRINNGEWWQQ